MTLTQILPFLAASLAVELTPGPNMFYITLLCARHGRLAGAYAIAGVALGLATIGMLAAFGFAALVAENTIAYELIRWAGVAYLLWLAFDAWRESRTELSETIADRKADFFTRGLVTNLLNPKAFLFYLTVVPSYVLATGAYRPQALTLTALYVLVATLVHAAIVLGAGSLTPLLRNPQWRERLGYLFAALLVLVAAWVAISTQR